MEPMDLIALLFPSVSKSQLYLIASDHSVSKSQVWSVFHPVSKSQFASFLSVSKSQFA